jgi:hypothetical protein
MKKWILLAVAAGALSCSVGAARALGPSELPQTWHIHDCTSACVLPHAPVAFFPAILTGGNVPAYLADPARCPDATDKAFLGGGQPPTSDGVEQNQPLREGVCMTSTTIIHLKSIAPDAPAKSGWTYLSTSGGFATYYLLTSVG